MPRFVKILLALAALAAVLVLGAGWVLSGAPMPAIPPARTAPPAGFDAALYPPLAAVPGNGRAAVLHVNAYGQPGESYTIPALGITYFTLFTPDEGRRMLFVDRSGALIGDITDGPLLFPMGAYMVTPDGYYSVTADGVSARQPMQDVSALGTARLSAMIAASTHYRSFAASDLPEGDADRAAGRDIHVMRHDGVWKRAASADLGQPQWKGMAFDDLDAVYQIARPSGAARPANFFGGRYRVELTHFDQREYWPARGAAFGSPTGQGSPAQWLGTGYYTLFRDSVPMLRFRIDDDRELLDGSRSSPLTANGSSGFDMLVLTHMDQRGQKTVIVVSGGGGGGGGNGSGG